VGKVAKVGVDRVKLPQEQSAQVLAELHKKFLDWKEQFVAQAPHGRGASDLAQQSTGPLPCF
jgi:stress response protein SCP2